MTLDATGGVDVRVGGDLWLAAGPTAVRNGAAWLTSSGQPPALRPVRCLLLFIYAWLLKFDQQGPLVQRVGQDRMGTFEETARNLTAANVTMTVGLRLYSASAMVAFHALPFGLRPAGLPASFEEVVTAFPTLGQPTRDLGAVWFEGTQLQLTRWLRWLRGSAFPDVHSSSTKGQADGAGMPLILHDVNGTALVAGPLGNFFVAAQVSA